jgi:hypothetical protein
MSGYIGSLGSFMWKSCEETCGLAESVADAVLNEANEVVKVFVKKAKEIEFLYNNMKFYTDVIMPAAEWTGNAFGESGELLKGAIKGPLKGFTAFATIGSSYDSSYKKVDALFKSNMFEAGAYISAAGAVCGTFNKAHDIATVGGKIFKVEVLSTLSSSFARINSVVFCAGSVFRAVSSLDALQAHVSGVDGYFGSHPARAKQYEHILSSSLGVIANVAVVVISGALLLESFAVITPIALGYALASAGFIGGIAKVGKLYYDDRQGLPLPRPPNPPAAGAGAV